MGGSRLPRYRDPHSIGAPAMYQEQRMPPRFYFTEQWPANQALVFIYEIFGLPGTTQQRGEIWFSYVVLPQP